MGNTKIQQKFGGTGIGDKLIRCVSGRYQVNSSQQVNAEKV